VALYHCLQESADLNKVLQTGDSGAWVIDVLTNSLYGHVVASDVFGISYVVPIQDAFQDIKLRLSLEAIDLPSNLVGMDPTATDSGIEIAAPTTQGRDDSERITSPTTASIATKPKSSPSKDNILARGLNSLARRANSRNAPASSSDKLPTRVSNWSIKDNAAIVRKALSRKSNPLSDRPSAKNNGPPVSINTLPGDSNTFSEGPTPRNDISVVSMTAATVSDRPFSETSMPDSGYNSIEGSRSSAHTARILL
jgi:hypothetical protein